MDAVNDQIKAQLAGKSGSTTVGPEDHAKAAVSTDKNTDIIASNTESMVAATEEQTKTITTDLRRKGIKIDKSHLENDLGKVMEKSVLEAARQALIEYAMYKDMKSDEIRKAIDTGKVDPKMLGNSMLTDTGVGGVAAPKNAAGGVVTGIGSNGMAAVSPAPGEGLASIGPGEKILPAGGGGGGSSVNITVNGSKELGDWLRPKVIDWVREYDRRKKNG